MNKEERSAYYKKWAKEHEVERKQYFKDYETNHPGRKFRNRYKIDITIEQYQEMLTSQSGKCAICGQSTSDKALAIDHDHKTGQIRGLLCDRCNMVLGRVYESTEILNNMIDYIKAYQ